MAARTASTCAIELQHVDLPTPPTPAKTVDCIDSISDPRHSSTKSTEEASQVIGELGGSEQGVTPTVHAMQKWNEPRENSYRLIASFWCFLVMGANDAAYGPLIPYLESYYGLDYTVVSLVFFSPFVGYIASAVLNNYVHLKLGQRGVAMISAGSHIAAYLIIALHPPYIGLVFAFILAGFGNGIADAAWNSWLGGMANSSQLLGFLHAFYGIGGVISPLVSTAMITKAHLPWYSYYYLMISFAVIEFAALTWSFWESTGAVYRSIYKEDELERETSLYEALFYMPTARVSWICAFFLLFYVGVEVALGGWIVTFMIQVRKGDAFASGMSAVGFWLGITVGRAVLGFVTPRLGLKLATSVYIAATMALELIFWLVPQFYVSTVAVSFQGFFLGPLFPSVVLVANQLLPRHQHVVVIGFASAFGGCGAAVLPFLTGILAQASGVQVLQPIIFSLLGIMLLTWLSLPKISKKTD